MDLNENKIKFFFIAYAFFDVCSSFDLWSKAVIGLIYLLQSLLFECTIRNWFEWNVWCNKNHRIFSRCCKFWIVCFGKLIVYSIKNLFLISVITWMVSESSFVITIRIRRIRISNLRKWITIEHIKAFNIILYCIISVKNITIYKLRIIILLILSNNH